MDGLDRVAAVSCVHQAAQLVSGKSVLNATSQKAERAQADGATAVSTADG
jgi:hypothetical protein